MYSIYLEGKKVSNNLTIDEAARSFKGIINWLKEYGHKCLVSVVYDETGEIIQDNGLYIKISWQTYFYMI